VTAFDAYYETTGYPHMTRHIARAAWNAALEAFASHREDCATHLCEHGSLRECGIALARSLMANPEERDGR
jgi:GrpB-like predicted nucleotidyltransferase (UPF0157 family)